MSDVKIYTVMSDELSPPITGEAFCTDMVRASDYAALEQQLAAVVAENAGVKKFGETLFEMHNALSGSGTGIQGNYEVVCQQLGLEAAMDAFDEIKTPATDAAIANIQAQGVEMFAKNAEVAEQGNGLMKAIARRAIKFAAQLRQGAAL